MTVGCTSNGREVGAERSMGLDVGVLLEKGWRPTPFQQFILKIHSRCNLACDYCYVYEMADQSWRAQPMRMSPRTVDVIATRIAEHARVHGLRRVELILHGGEPLLAGADLIRHVVTAIRGAVDDGVETVFRLQTNGVLLDTEFLRLFAELGILVGVSLDGDEAGHDRRRRHADGRGSHAAVVAGLARLASPDYRHLFSGLLATIDVRNDPIATYEALLYANPPAVDFLLPHGNWDNPPPGHQIGVSPPVYGAWLIAVFDRWYHAPVQETRVRLFSEIIGLLFGRPSQSEDLGLSPVAAVVVETDGSIEQVDTLKSAYDGAAGTGLHLSRDAFDAALSLPSVAARQIGERALAPQCRSCEMLRVCGGGLYPHRYRSDNGFANPSVYCADLLYLIRHILDTLRADLSALRKSGAT
jgi:uncharacterized protein